MSYYTPLRVEADQKEIIINQLKGEVYNLKKNEQDYYYLEDQFKKLEHKYRLLQEDKLLADNEYRSRHDLALRNISQLKNESDVLRAELRDRNLELGDLDTDGNTLKTQLDQRNIEIEKLKTDINSLLADSEELLAERARLEQQFAMLKADKGKLLDELKNLECDHDSVRRKIIDLEKYLGQIDNDGKILRDKILQFENDNNALDEQILNLTDAMNDLERAIAEQLKGQKNLQNDLASLQSTSDKNKSQAAHFHKATQLELLKNSDLAKTLNQAENTLRTRDAQISEASKQIRDIDLQNQSLCDLNSRLDIDFEELQKHLENMTLQNSQLIVELERYSAEDDIVRNLIDRKARILRARARVEEVITFSRATAASPVQQSRIIKKSKIIY